MRILYLTAGYTVHDARFIGTAAKAGHELLLVRLDRTRPAALPPLAREVGWHPPGIARPSDVGPLASEFSRIISDERPDVVHAGPVQTSGYLAALVSVRPLLLMSWGSDLLVDAERDEEWRNATIRAIRAADLLLCDNDAVAEKATDLGYPADRIVVFPWGVDLDRFAPTAGREAMRRHLRLDGSFAVLSTRSWEPIYGIDILLRAFVRALRQRADLVLVLVGGGSRAADIERTIEELGIGSSVIRPGVLPHDRLPALFAAADVYVSCSRSDGTSVSLLEAMASGLPVIAGDIPGNTEWVVPGDNGWLAKDGDPESFATAILAAAELDRTTRARIARTNRRVVEERADWRVGSRTLLSAYERALLTRSGASA